MTEITPILILATDQATTGPTGIALATYNPAGSIKTILFTGTTKGLPALRDKMVEIHRAFPDLDIVAHEGGYFDPKTPKGGEGTWVSGGWVEGIASILWRDAARMTFKANDWRRIVHGPTSKVKDWKAKQLQWAQAIDPTITDHNIGDACGILAAAGAEWYKKHGVE